MACKFKRINTLKCPAFFFMCVSLRHLYFQLWLHNTMCASRAWKSEILSHSLSVCCHGSIPITAVFSNSCTIALLSGEVGRDDSVTEQEREREGGRDLNSPFHAVPRIPFFPLALPWRDLFNCIPEEFILQLVLQLMGASGNWEWLCLEEEGIFSEKRREEKKLSYFGKGTARKKLILIQDSTLLSFVSCR